jgi:hypothetical protein
MEARFKPFVKDGETFICITSQSGGRTLEPTPEQLAVSGKIVNTPTRWGFFANNTLYKNTTATCKALLNRNGATNEWRGPRHVYVCRDGVWKRFDTLSYDSYEEAIYNNLV